MVASPVPAIHLADVTVERNGRAVLTNLSLTVQPGDTYALLGGNGAGKSTTISTLLGFLPVASGDIKVCGDDPTRDGDKARRHIAFLPENVALYEHLTARENIAYLLALAGDRSSDDHINSALDATGLQREARDRRLSGFSKGMRQKVAIALASLRQAPVLLLDEPTSGLDPRAVEDFRHLMNEFKTAGTAILMVTHDLLGAADCADRIGFLAGGRIVDEVAASGAERFDVRALRHRYGQTEAA